MFSKPSNPSKGLLGSCSESSNMCLRTEIQESSFTIRRIHIETIHQTHLGSVQTAETVHAWAVRIHHLFPSNEPRFALAQQ